MAGHRQRSLRDETLLMHNLSDKIKLKILPTEMTAWIHDGSLRCLRVLAFDTGQCSVLPHLDANNIVLASQQPDLPIGLVNLTLHLSRIELKGRRARSKCEGKGQRGVG
jgi:hypothetical protein